MEQTESTGEESAAGRPQASSSRSATAATALIGLALVLLLQGCSRESASQPAGNGLPNVDAANTRRVGGPIDATTVSNLTPLWTLPARVKEPLGSYSSTPVVVDGIVYAQDLASNVQAIDLEDGDVLWETPYASTAMGSDGLAVIGNRVYGTTSTNAFALDRQSGKEIWSTGLTRNDAEEIHMAPGYHNGLVYVSSLPKFGKAGGVGVLWALDGKTGQKMWSFDTVPRGLWGHPAVNSGGGVSTTPAFDAKGSMYFGVGSPGPIPGTAQFPWGSSRPGRNLYTSSIVKLDTKTGKPLWHYQLTPHSLCNWGLQEPPILLETPKANLVIATGTSGVVVALDQESGKLVWRRSVGTHNGHDSDGLYAMRGEYGKLKSPLTAYPGQFGGVAAPSSTNGSSLFVPVVNFGTTLLNQSQATQIGSDSGELLALDVATGSVRWKHTFPAAAFGATTVANDVVFATTLDKTLHAFDGGNGRELWRTSLPANVSGGIAVSGATLVAPAGAGGKEGILAYRLPG